MSTRAPTKETWRDWFEWEEGYDFENDEVTLDVLLESLQGYLKDEERVTADNIRYWQKIGVLPRPIKRWHDGATRALYPRWAAMETIFELLELQRRGYTLQQIKTRLHAWVFSLKRDDPLGIRENVAAIARKYEDLLETEVAEIELRFTATDGRERSYIYPASGNSPVVVDLHNHRPDRSEDTER